MTNSSRSSMDSDNAEHPHGRNPANRTPAEAMRHNPCFGIMNHLMVETVKIIFPTAKGGGNWDANDVISRGVESGKSALMDRTQLGISDD
jgi:hypothetical protein